MFASSLVTIGILLCVATLVQDDTIDIDPESFDQAHMQRRNDEYRIEKEKENKRKDQEQWDNLPDLLKALDDTAKKGLTRLCWSKGECCHPWRECDYYGSDSATKLTVSDYWCWNPVFDPELKKWFETKGFRFGDRFKVDDDGCTNSYGDYRGGCILWGDSIIVE